MPQDPRRIIIVGPPGAGKTTLARKLGQIYGLPVHHVDQFWHEAWPALSPMSEVHSRVREIATGPMWVIDGMPSAALSKLGLNADLIISYHIGLAARYWRCLRRTTSNYGRGRSDTGPKYRDYFWRPLYYRVIPYWDDRNQPLVDKALVVLRGQRPVLEFRSVSDIDRFYANPEPAISGALGIDQSARTP